MPYAASMRFDLTDLRLFLTVADAGGITHGAADAGLSLPAASARLWDMDLSGGVRLLERGRRDTDRDGRGAGPSCAGKFCSGSRSRAPLVRKVSSSGRKVHCFDRQRIEGG